MLDRLLPSDLLLMLDALVTTDGAPAGISGRLSIGVQGELGTFWWAAHLGGEVVTRFPRRAPPGADAIFLLGEAEALAVMTGAPFPERPRLEIQGDWSLVERFFRRYLSSRRRREAKSGSYRLERLGSQSGLSQRIRPNGSSTRLREIRSKA